MMSSGDSAESVCINGGGPRAKRVRTKDRISESKDGHKVELLGLHHRPFITIYYAMREIMCLSITFLGYLLSHKKTILLILVTIATLLSANLIEGSHQQIFKNAFQKVQWWMWWIVLGFLSSCGFGSGLHTFVLYLGPFIASVTMAAYECGSTNFPSPPYPDEFLCPETGGKKEMSALLIVHKVLLESVLWGFGTAVGELPPYFMARAAALSGTSDKVDISSEDTSPWHERAQNIMRIIVKKIGFMGIMLCASVPNPLFDLAGMTCGHFLVPFSTFFGATVIGKAVNKMLLQLAFVVIIFSKDKVAWIQSCIKDIPKYGTSLNSLIDEFLLQQKEKIHRSIVSDKQSWLQLFFSYLQLIVILGFVVSIIHSLANSYAHRLRQWQTEYSQYIDHSKQKNH